MRAHDVGRQRFAKTCILGRAAERVDLGEHAIARALFGCIDCVHWQEIGQRLREQRLPIGACADCATSSAARPINDEQLDQRIERIERGAFEIRPRRHAGDVGIVAGGVTEQQAIEREAPRERIVGGRAEPRAMCRVESPARAGRLDPARRRSIDSASRSKRRISGGNAMRSSTSLLVARDCAEIEQAQNEIGDRRGDQRAFVGDRVRNETRRALRAAEHRRDVRRIEIDVGRHHGDVARLELRIFLEQRAQLIVQHFDFAHTRVASVHLQCALAFDRRRAEAFGRSARAFRADRAACVAEDRTAARARRRTRSRRASPVRTRTASR